MNKKKGLAALTPERRKEIARKGGLATAKGPNTGRFAKGSDRASAAGKVGGVKSKRRKI